MPVFMAESIKDACDKRGVEAGRELYHAYFGRLPIYERYRAQVEVILTTDGYGECIVE